ncbi:MAG: hypothetical protein CMD81_12120 [Gammaproteobacteria bacterium]|nr:hypothetical protein [Gammaproteobacteria bacterium]HBF09219.1 hypothetical protein [Gammaproteobacteria bacterium]
MAGRVHVKSQSFDFGVDDHLTLAAPVANRSLDNKPLLKTPDQDPNKGLMRSFSARAYGYASQRKNSISKQVDSYLDAIDTARSKSFESLKTDRIALLESFKAPVDQERLTQVATQAEQISRFTKTLLKFAGVNYGGFVIKHGLAFTTAAVSFGIVNAIKGSFVLAFDKPELDVRVANSTPTINNKPLYNDPPYDKMGVFLFQVFAPENNHNKTIGLTATQSLKRSISHYSKSGRTNKEEQHKDTQQNELQKLIGRVQKDMQNKLFKDYDEAKKFMEHSLNKHYKKHEIKVALSSHILALPLLLCLELKSLKRQQQTGKLRVTAQEFTQRENDKVKYQTNQMKNQLAIESLKSENLEQELRLLKPELRLEKDKNRNITDKLSVQNDKIAALQRSIESLEEKNNGAQQIIQTLNRRNNKLSENNMSFLELLQKTTNQNQDLRAEIYELQDVLAETECQRDDTRNQLKATQAKIDYLTFHYQQQQATLDQYQQQMNDLSETLHFYKNKEAELGALNQELETQLQELVQESQAMHFNMLDTDDKNEALLQENLQLKRELRMAHSNNKYLTSIALESPIASPKSLLTGQPISPRTPQQQARDMQFKHNHVRSLTESNAEKDGIIRVLQQEYKKLQGQLTASQSDVQTLSNTNEVLSKKLIGLDLTHQAIAASNSHAREPSLDRNWIF